MQDASDTRAGDVTQQRLFAEVTAVLQTLAQQRPLLLVLDDLQWADLGSLNLLFHLSRELIDTPILLIGIYRASDVALGRNGARHPLTAVVNELQRRFGERRIDLGQTSAPAFVDALLDTLPNRFSAEFRQAFYQHTQGHALFAVEMLRGLQERGDLARDERGRWVATEPLDWALLPARVEGILRERIERLSTEHQQLLQIACVEGETFTAQVIASIQQRDLSTVVQQLSGVLDRQHRLIQADAAVKGATGPMARYRFRHILFKQFAYQRLDPVERQQTHAAVAQTLETLHQASTADVAILLAHHFQLGGQSQMAIHHLLLAGRRANQVAAYAEAILHLTKGIELLQELPASSARHRQELEFQLALGPAQRIINGYRSPELEATYGRAQELCKLLGDPLELFPVLWAMLSFYWVRPDLSTAHTMAQRRRTIAQSQPESDRLLAVNRALGAVSLIMGDFCAAQQYLEEAIALYHAQGEQTDVDLYGFDNGICSLFYHSWLLWLFGYPDQARDQIRATCQRADTLGRPFERIVAHVFACRIGYARGDFAEVRQAAATLVEMARQHNIASWPAYGTIQSKMPGQPENDTYEWDLR